MKTKLVEYNMILPDEIYLEAREQLTAVQEAQAAVYDNFPTKKHPDAVFCTAYQDGLIHALEKILKTRITGEYSHRCENYAKANHYDDLENIAINNILYFDAAYLNGYKSILWFFSCWGAEREKLLPGLFFHFGSKKFLIDSLEDYKKVLKDSQTIHKPSHAWAQKEAVKLETSKGTLLIHHRCEL